MCEGPTEVAFKNLYFFEVIIDTQSVLPDADSDSDSDLDSTGTEGQNSQESKGKYWATHSSVCSFPRTAHPFACFALLT